MLHRPKTKLVITVFIITVIIIWFATSEHHLFNKQISLTNRNVVSNKTTNIEKIDNFFLQEFDANQKLFRSIKAKSYFNFKDKADVLLSPEIITYDKKGDKNYTLRSKKAHYLNNDEIKFQGKVDVRTAGDNSLIHKLNTQELLVNPKIHDLFSDKQVIYLGKNSNIVAQGMRLKAKSDKMKLIGAIKINQDGGQKISTTNLYVNQSKNKQLHYHSKNQTTYSSKHNTIYASKGVDINTQKQLYKLFGRIKILQNSNLSEINTQNLNVNQKNGVEIYHTQHKTYYKSNFVNIRAMNLHYDALKQKINLSGGVVGYYE